MSASRPITTEEAIVLLESGELEVVGRMPWSSNQTFLARLLHDGTHTFTVYKPRRGERPLWDFPDGTLCEREVAAFELSEALGWAIVPPTILRDGPMGVGMVQLFIDHDPEQHYLTLFDDFTERFRYFAAFDHIINNADRKAGHCLRDERDHVWGIDHGVSFHTAPHLRTVIWDFAGEHLPEAIASDVCRMIETFDDAVAPRLQDLLDPAEAGCVRARCERLLALGRFPNPRHDHPYPWPMV